MKTVDFSETIEASDLKVGRSRHLIEFMKECEVISCPWPKVVYIQTRRPMVLKNAHLRSGPSISTQHTNPK